MTSKSRGPGPPEMFRGLGWILGTIALIALMTPASSETNKRYDMQTLCEDRFRQQLYRKIEGAFLKSQNERNLDCIVTFQTHSILQRFMLRFDQLQLDCNDHLFIYDGAHIVDSYKGKMMLSEDNQRQSRSELQTLISLMNKSKRYGIRRTPRFRFRAAVRKVINNLKWLTEEPSGVKEKMSAKGPKLTTQIKGLLLTDVEDRSSEDKNYLFKIIGNLSCLQRYPEKVRQNLTASSIFAYFGPGRTLVMEGRPSFNMYFIISGQASVSKMMYDAGEDKLKASEVATMSAGDSFGEINILHDEPWPTTVTTVTHIELLRVRKRDFQRILEEFLGEQKEEITRCLNDFSYFKDWTNRTIVECCILSRIQHFPKDSLIIGDKVGNVGNSYFIVSGECVVMYHLETRTGDREKFGGKIRLRSEAPDEESFPLSRLLRGLERERMRKIGEPHLVHLIVNETLERLIDELPISNRSSSDPGRQVREISIESHFFKIAVLMKGQCFGIGESLEDKFILSNSDPVVVLEIPRHFLKLHNRGNIWGRVREFFNLTYPTPREVFKKFKSDRKWQMCRRRYAESVLNVNRPFTGLTVAEQPYYYRLFEDILNPMFNRIRKTQADLSCRNTKTSVGVIFTRTNYVTLKYVTDNWGTESNGFRLVITAVKDPKHECKDFRCYQKEFCVHPQLLCDGISHCADGSDESPTRCSQNDGGSILGISLPIFVVVLISLLLILSALGVIAGLIFCRNRHGMQQGTPSHSQHSQHQVYTGTNGTSQIHVQKSTVVHGTTVITPMTVNWVHPVVRGYLVAWARLYCQAE